MSRKSRPPAPEEKQQKQPEDDQKQFQGSKSGESKDQKVDRNRDGKIDEKDERVDRNHDGKLDEKDDLVDRNHDGKIDEKDDLTQSNAKDDPKLKSAASKDQQQQPDENRFQMPPMPKFQALPLREYYDNNLSAVLLEGLKQIGRERPTNPIKFLGEYLLQHDPENKPKK